jgi:polysaccharide biosynthesis protein PslH
VLIHRSNLRTDINAKETVGESLKILWVKPGKILPLDSGGKLRTYHILRHLARNHCVTYLSYYGGARDETYEREILQHVPGAIAINTGAARVSGYRRYLDYARRLQSAAPYAVSQFASTRVQKMVAECMVRRDFDVAVCDFLASAPNFPLTLNIPTVLFQHNVETTLWKRRSEFAAGWPERAIAKLEYAKMARYEAQQVRRFHHVIAVSEEDRRSMSRMTDGSRISVIPTGVDLTKYSYDPEFRPVGSLVVFSGSMDWEPNIDGVEFFCKDIWPLVLARIPEARLRIVGREPDPRVKKPASRSVHVTGTVPSVIDHLREAAVLVVPLRIGGGTRIKIYEGMAMGKATVSTSVGAEGLDVHHQRDILLSDDAHSFAESVIRLLRDEAFRQRVEVAAVATASQYDWSVVSRRFAEILQEKVASFAPGIVTSARFVTA